MYNKSTPYAFLKAGYTLMIVLCLLFFVISLTSRAQAPPSNIADSLQAILDRSLPAGVQNPGVVMSVHVPGKWTWSGASGHAISGMSSGQPATMAAPTDKFRVGSISKTFMATAIMMLEEQGLLSIEDTIGKYLRASLVYDTIQSSEPVRIRHLLNHTSGIDNSANNTSCQQNALADLTASHTLEEAIYCGASQGEIFPPEFAWAYSNTNYSILAMILQNITGQTSMDYIQQHIITPLGLTQTEIPSTVSINNNHMGCYWNIGTWIDMTDVNASLYWGWADIVSTTTDLNTFYHALLSGQLVNQNSLTKMFTMFPGTYDYGLGLDFYSIGNNNDAYFGHTGEVGNSSSMWYANTVTSNIPNGYFISYNFNYQGVDMWTVIDDPVYNLLTTMVTSTLSANAPSIKTKVYPNPAKENITFMVEHLNSTATLLVYDISGRLIFNIQTDDNKSSSFTLDLNGIDSGVYSYEIRTSNTVCTGKFVKTE